MNALFESLHAVRITTSLGARVGMALQQSTATTLDASTHAADVAALVAAVEADMRRRLGDGSGSGGGSSSSAGGASPPAMMPTAAAVEIPEAIDARLTLRQHVRWLLESRLSRHLVAEESAQLDKVLAEALSLFQAGGDAAQQQLLTTDMASALLIPGVAHLWGCVVEAAEGDVRTVDSFADTLHDTTSAVAGALFASAFGL